MFTRLSHNWPTFAKVFARVLAKDINSCFLEETLEHTSLQPHTLKFQELQSFYRIREKKIIFVDKY